MKMREGIVILGAPRSGTTLLRRLLNAHPRIACPSETNLLSACARFLHGEPITGGVEVGVLTGLAYAGFPPEEVFTRLREFAFGFLREHARRQDKPRWCEKTAFDAFHLDRIEQLCAGQVQYIIVLRHGLDVATSLNELSTRNGRYLEELHSYIRRFPAPIEAFSECWLDLTRALRALASRDPEGTLVVRYEDLVAEPGTQLARICAFLDEDCPDDLLDHALAARDSPGLGDWKTYGEAGLSTGSLERWKTLPADTIHALAPRLNPMLAECGYSPLPEGALPTDEQARRRYALGLMIQGLKPPSDKR
jgi:hypothetical protein